MIYTRDLRNLGALGGPSYLLSYLATYAIKARETIERSAKKVDQFETRGQETGYTNTNHVLLQEIVRKVSGEPLGDRIEEGILGPIGMKDSFYANEVELPGTL